MPPDAQGSPLVQPSACEGVGGHAAQPNDSVTRADPGEQARKLRICVLQPDYGNSDSAFKDVDLYCTPEVYDKGASGPMHAGTLLG